MQDTEKLLLKNASYSKIDKYKQCPFAYNLNYNEHINPYSQNIATVFGKAIHAAEEAIANDIIAGKEINYTKYKNKFILENYKIQYEYLAEYFNNVEKQYAEHAKEYLDERIYRLENFMKEHPTYKIIGAEVDFKDVEIEGVSFQGAIDRLLYDIATDSYIIHDIKSWVKPADEIETKTPLQFLVYAEAVKKLYNADIDKITCFYDLPCCNMYQEVCTSGWIKRGHEQLKKLFEKIENKNYDPTPSPLCNYCPYSKTNPDARFDTKYLCPYYSIWLRETKIPSDRNACEFYFNPQNDYLEILQMSLNKSNINMNAAEYAVLYNKNKEEEKLKKKNKIS